MSLDESESVGSVLTFLSGYDTLEYSWVKATAVSVRLRNLFVTLQNTNKRLTLQMEKKEPARHSTAGPMTRGKTQYDAQLALGGTSRQAGPSTSGIHQFP